MTREKNIEVRVIDPGQKYKEVKHWQRLTYGVEGQFFMDVVKLLSMCCDDGKMVLTEAQAVDRAAEIVRLSVAAMEKNDWSEVVPSADDLLIDGQAMGFGKVA